MAHKITDACVSCGTCAENCPVEAITQGDTQYEINPATWVHGGASPAHGPVDAIGAEKAKHRHKRGTRPGDPGRLPLCIILSKAGYYASRSSRRQSMAASWPRVAVWSAP